MGGCGAGPAPQPRAFEAFDVLDRDSARRPGGRGASCLYS
ncbi:hypothetical protein HMPREF9062_1042 [Actinomyces sp. oral taxon 448 str. F0400]|nr:hypothetical protein HMPREF9062_1042 [Actinomyces sp. oral taxon 448 str. F0400]